MKTLKTYNEAAEKEQELTAQHIKMGIGIARDKRYAGGNMTGAIKAMDKVHPKLSEHPAVRDELRKMNESCHTPKQRRISKMRKIVETALNKLDPHADYAAKSKALQDIQMDPETSKDKQMSKAVMQRKADLEKEYEPYRKQKN